jgi:hypothetical protein
MQQAGASFERHQLPRHDRDAVATIAFNAVIEFVRTALAGFGGCRHYLPRKSSNVPATVSVQGFLAGVSWDGI